MFHVAIVGDHGSGKTTFLGLVYAALVSSGSSREGDLRFHVAYESLDEIAALYQRLMSGGFPDSATKEGLHELSLEVDATGAGRGVFARLGSRKGDTRRSSAIRFSLPGSLDEPRSGFQQGSTFGTGKWRDALDADVLVMLADATRLASKGVDPKAAPFAEYDAHLEALFIAIQRWRSSGGRGLLHPVFVLSRFDAVRPEVLKAAKLERVPPAADKVGPRTAYGTALLEPNVPRTLALLRGPVGKKLRFAPLSFFFSSVRAEPAGADKAERIKLRRTESGGWEPDYARSEYLAFLESVRRIAAETKD